MIDDAAHARSFATQGHLLGHCSARRNEPNVHKAEMRDNGDRWHGAQLSLIIAGHWQYYRAKVLADGLSRRCLPWSHVLRA